MDLYRFCGIAGFLDVDIWHDIWFKKGEGEKRIGRIDQTCYVARNSSPLSLSLSLSLFDNCANCVNCNAVNRRQIWVTWIDLSDTSLHVLTFNSSRSRQYGKASGQPNNFSSLATTSDNFTTAKRKVRRMQSRGVHARALNRDTRCKSCIELESYAGVLKHSADSNWVLSLRF